MRALVMSAMVVVSAPIALAGPDWTEVNDAGKNTPQDVAIGTQPKTIMGSLGGATSDADGGVDAVDAYLLMIEEPESFIATTEPPLSPFQEDEAKGARGIPGAIFNSSMWLFRVDRTGIVANRDISNNNLRSRIFPMATDGTPARIPGPGEYVLAISYGDVNPTTTAGQNIFNFDDGLGNTQISGPDGPGGPNAAAGTWNIPSGSRPQVTYLIRVLGGPCPTPCIGDANNDRVVNFTDISFVLANFGRMCP